MTTELTYEELVQKVQQLEEERKTQSGFSRQGAKAVLAMSSVMNIEGRLEDHLPQIAEHLSQLLNVERSTLFVLSGEYLRLMLTTGFAEGFEGSISLDLQMGLVGTCVLNDKVVNVANAYDDLRFYQKIDQQTGFRTESVLCVPLHDDTGSVLGALQLLNKKTGVFTTDDEQYALQRTGELDANDLDSDLGKEKIVTLLDELKEALSCARGSVFVFDQASGTLRSVVADGVVGGDLQVSMNLGIAGISAITGQEFIINDAYADPRFNQNSDRKSGFQTRQILCIPMKNQSGKIIGVIQGINKREGVFDQSDVDLLKQVTTFLAMYIENSLLLKEYRQQFESVLEVMAASIDAKDPLTASHSKMVREYSLGIARELGFKEQDLDVLNVAAWLHDYGKLGIKEEVLTKPGRLSAEEFDHIKEHAAKTRIILEKMFLAPRYRNVPLVASCHHERLDGTGYGNGLHEQEIPFLAKIITVADVFDALTAKRHYREAMPDEKALAILEQGIGTQFDENIVAAMKQYLQKRKSS